MWSELHAQRPASEKILIASELFTAVRSDVRKVVWLFEWMVGADGVWPKKGRLDREGVDLLCALLDALPASYPLGSQTPLLASQLRGELQLAQSQLLAANAFDEKSLLAHNNLLSLLLHRSALSFRLTPEQAFPLFANAVEVLETMVGSSPYDCRASALLAAGTATLLKHALKLTSAKKEFRCLVSAMLPASRLFACAPADLVSFATGSSAVTAGSNAVAWTSAMSQVRLLLRGFFNQRHLEGLETLARTSCKYLPERQTNGLEEPVQKKARTDGDSKPSKTLAVYQAELFIGISDLLQRCESSIGCSRILPDMFDDFVLEHRRASSCKAMLAESTGLLSTKQMVHDPGLDVPCEFWFFEHLSASLRLAITRRTSDSNLIPRSDSASPLVCSLVELWRRVRMHGAYRLREDPKLIQTKSLRSFCTLMLDRLECGNGSSSAWNAPEWNGILEVLQLDASSLETCQQRLWTLVLGLYPGDVESETFSSAGPVRCVQLGVSLLLTYAHMADLPSCILAMVESFKASSLTRVKRLLADPYFVRGVHDAASHISGGSSASQSVAIWNSLLMNLSTTVIGSEAHGGAALLVHFIGGLRASELTLRPLRDLVLSTFTMLADDSILFPLGENKDSLLLAACKLGRELVSWDLPQYLPTTSDSSILAQHIERGLQSLALGSLQKEHAGVSLDVTIEASVLWLASKEPIGQVGAEICCRRAKKDEVLLTKVLHRLLELAAGQWGRADAQRTVCQLLPLLVAQVVDSTSRKKGVNIPAFGDMGEDAPLVLLGEMMLPPEHAGWRHIAARSGVMAGSHGKEGQGRDTDEAWAPLALLWTSGVEIILEKALPLHSHLLHRVAGLIETALSLLNQQPLSRKHTRCNKTLLGLCVALQNLTATQLRGASVEAVAATIRAVVATILRTCASFSHAQTSVDSGTCVLDIAVHCLRNLVELLGSFSSEETTSILQEVLPLVIGPWSNGHSKGTSSSSSLSAVAAMVGVLHIASTSDAVAHSITLSLAALSRSLFRIRYCVWSYEDRRFWAVGLLKSLFDPLLTGHTKETSSFNGRLRVHLPQPLMLLSSSSPVSCGCSSAEFDSRVRSLRILRDVMETSFRAKDSRSLPSLGQSVTLVLPMSFSPEAGTMDNDCIEQCCVCAGLVLEVLARCVELGCCDAELVAEEDDVAMLDVVDFRLEDNPSRLRAPHTAALVSLATEIERRVTRRRELVVGEQVGRADLRLGITKLLRALTGSACSIWSSPSAHHGSGKDADSEWWSWVAAVVEWAELTSVSDSVALLQVAPSGRPRKYCYIAGVDLCQALCNYPGASRDRREYVVEMLAARASASAATTSCCLLEEDDARTSCMTMAIFLAAVLRDLPQPPLRPKVAGRVVSATWALLTVTDSPESVGISAMTAPQLVCLLCLGDIAESLYAHLAMKQQRAAKGPLRTAHFKLPESEALLLHMAGRLARIGRVSDAPKAVFASASFSDLLAASYKLMSALFSSVPQEGQKLPTWTQKPHLIVGVMKLLVEAVYDAPCGSAAASVAADVSRLWEAFASGGTRLVARSAGRSGQSTLQAKVQRATQSFVIMLIGHALEQQRLWRGVDAAVQRSLLNHSCLRDDDDPLATASKEADAWREAISLLQAGMGKLLDCLEGAEHIKQGLYASLREPLNKMFKELHEGFQQRTRYKGEA